MGVVGLLVLTTQGAKSTRRISHATFSLASFRRPLCFPAMACEKAAKKKEERRRKKERTGPARSRWPARHTPPRTPAVLRHGPCECRAPFLAAGRPEARGALQGLPKPERISRLAAGLPWRRSPISPRGKKKEIKVEAEERPRPRPITLAHQTRHEVSRWGTTLMRSCGHGAP